MRTLRLSKTKSQTVSKADMRPVEPERKQSKLLYLLAVVCLVAVVGKASCAAVRKRAEAMPFLSPMFGSGMVLQREMADPIWGWAEPGSKVTISVVKTGSGARSNASAVTDKSGKWMAKLQPMPAGGPYTIEIKGTQSVKLDNVLAGDVWICSGQSNMEMGIGNVTNAQQEIASADYPQIRLFTVEKKVAYEPQNLVSGKWDVCTPQTVAAGGWNGFTAVGYFFGRTLHQELKVPIGLIHTSWGGTIAEAWTSAEALKSMPDFQHPLDAMAQARADIARGANDFPKRMAEWWAKNDPGSATGSEWAAPAFDTAGWKTMKLPTYWEVAGLPDFDGVVWFRKEFDLPAGVENKDLMLHLGPIDDRDTTFVNGVLVGGQDAYNLPRDYKVPASALKPGKNVIAVRVLDTGGNGGIYGKPEEMRLEIPGADTISLAGDWLYKDSVPLSKTSALPAQVTNDPNQVTVLYNAMIAPVVPFGIKGAIWYQGESNAGRAFQYRTLLPTMIADWRSRFGVGKFPFYIVQLANFQASQPEPSDNEWAELREAQSMTAQNIPNSGIAVTIDIGDANDIHPKDKQDVGKRLALAALAKTYGKKVEYSGPHYTSMKVEGGSVRLKFDHADGLTARDGGALTGFTIAGEDHHFHNATARIDGDSIIVLAPEVSSPTAVRYAWAINPISNLVNKAGLPASPFRTDTLPGITVNNK